MRREFERCLKRPVKGWLCGYSLGKFEWKEGGGAGGKGGAGGVGALKYIFCGLHAIVE